MRFFLKQVKQGHRSILRIRLGYANKAGPVPKQALCIQAIKNSSFPAAVFQQLFRNDGTNAMFKFGNIDQICFCLKYE